MADPTAVVRPTQDPGPGPRWPTRLRALLSRDPATSALLALLVLVIVGTIGRPLVGIGSLHAADTMQLLDPWAQTAPDEFRPDNGTVSDTVDAVAPVRLSIADRARHGDLALWSSTQGGGAPLLGIPNSAMLSPMNLPWWLATGHWAPALAKALQMAVASLFLFLFARRLGASRPAALVGALSFVNAGFLVVWTTWPQSSVAALVPALFWAVDVVAAPGPPRTRLRVGGIIALAIVGASMWLEGFPALTLWAHLLAAAWAIVRLRPTLPGRAARAGGVLAGMVVGLGVAAVQLLPFAFRIQELDTSTRAAKAADALPWESLATVLAPNALGSAGDGVWFAPRNEVELQAFLGAAGVALVLVALVSRRRLPVAGTKAFAAIATVVVAALIWAGGPLHDAVQSLPILGGNQTGRLRGLLAFLLSVLVAVGYDAVRQRTWANDQDDADRSLDLRAAGAALAVALVSIPVVVRVVSLADRAGRDDFAAAALLGPAALLVVILLAVSVATRTTSARARQVALALVPLLLAIEAVAFARGFLPRIDSDQFYPRTEAHDVVADLTATNRFAAGDRALYPGTTTAYGLRGLTAHAGMPAAWKALLDEVDPHVHDGNATFPILAATPEVATSSTLDLLGVTHFVTAMDVAVFGSRDEPILVGGVALPGRPIHGVEVGRAALAVLADHDLPASLVVTVLDDLDMVVAHGQRRLTGRESGPWLSVPVAPATPTTPGPIRGRITVAVRLDPPTVDTPASLAPVHVAVPDDVEVRAVRAPIGAPRIVAAPGVAVYVRPKALPRIRFEADLASARPTPVVVRDSQDVIDIDLVAVTGGTVVVADAWSAGHRATVDGRHVEVNVVHGALVGIPVTAGAHRVRVWWEPEGVRTGAVVTVLSLLGLCLLGLASATGRFDPEVGKQLAGAVGEGVAGQDGGATSA